MALVARPRSFDYDEALRLRDQGLSYAEIGARLGVSDTAARNACDPRARIQQRRATRRAIEAARTPCRGGCGVLVYMHNKGSSGYCKACYAERFWRIEKHGTEKEYVSWGCRCHACTAAASAARRARRLRSQVPCSHGCGRMVDRYNARYPDKPPECKSCAMRRVTAERRAALEVAA